jgi:hypothetical protein
MKVVRKKRKGIRIEHNKRLFMVIIILLILLISVIWIIIKDRDQITEIIQEDLCLSDEDCVPSSCCHPESCTIKEKEPDCESSFCSQVCSGPLDCGVGKCGCIDNTCEIISNE